MRGEVEGFGRGIAEGLKDEKMRGLREGKLTV
jgi:hypothetical protein